MELNFEEMNSQLSNLVSSKQDFVVYGLTDKIIDTAKIIETEIEKQNMSCRVYTRNRGYAAATAMLTVPAGVASITGIMIHNIATYNPDFEVSKDIIENKIYVTYKKD